MRTRQLLSCLVIAAITTSCGGGVEPTKPPPVNNTPVVTSVGVSISITQMEVATSQTVSADVRDQTGSVITGKSVTWSSSAVAVATIDAAGTLTAVAAGTSTITATVDGKSGTSIVTVIGPKVASVAIAPVAGTLLPGMTVNLLAILKDKTGAVLTGRFISWQSTNARVGVIDANGNFTARSGGTTDITASSEGILGQLTVVVSPPVGALLPTITSISPALLTPGTIATITGANFVAGPAGTEVNIAGVSAPVSVATTTQLTVQVPTGGLPCASTQPVSVDVFTIAGSGTIKQPLATATTRTLAVGASFLATASSNLACNELPANGTYIVSVFNAATTLNANAGFELKGIAGGISASKFAQADMLKSVNVTSAPPAPRSFIDPALAAQAHEHLQHLEHDMQLLRDLARPENFYRRPTRTNLSRGFSPNSRSSSLTPVPLTVGQTATINFNYNSCTAGVSPVITARVVYVGPKAVVLEDNAGTLAGKIDGDMIALAQEWETVSYPLLLNFGNPLVWDDSTDANGKIIMMFTPKVNSAGANLLGFVQSCDLFAPTTAAQVSGSNQAEIFYARAVTDTTPTSTSLNGRPQWRRNMPSTLIHESKHITAFAERFADPRPAFNEVTWLEEATAQVASELYGRAIHGNGWRTNSPYFGTLDCEVRPGVPACGQGNFIMGNHFLFLADFLANFEQKTILSGTDDNDIYGSSWLFVRWLTDTYGGSDEGTFLRSIVKAVTTTGVVNVTTPSGKTWPELLSQFTLMLGADETPGVAAPFVEASWSLPAVFLGYNEDLRNPPPAVPLTMRQASFGSAFQAAVQLRGGGAMLLKVSGSAVASPQLLDLHALSGLPLS
ncbi:MAG: Ig-like domain-containing protein, partial [bacterium]